MNSKTVKRLKTAAKEIQAEYAKKKKYYTLHDILAQLKKQWKNTPKEKRNSKQIVFES